MASFACGGWSAKVQGLNVSDVASYSKTAHPHPPLSANLLLSFTMKSMSCCVPGTQHDVDLMVKDSKRFADSGGWGYGAFEYDAASDTFTPATLKDKPPQGNDARCGFACHTAVKTKDYVFTDYGHR